MKKMYSLVQITIILIGFIVLSTVESYAASSSTSVGLSSSVNPSSYGQPVTFTATVTKLSSTGGSGPGVNSTGGSGSGGNSTGGIGEGIFNSTGGIGEGSFDVAPTGTVTFYDGSVQLGTITLNTAGGATFNTSLLSSGAHTITAVYSGDINYKSNSSSQLSQVVGKVSTTIGLSSSVNPSIYGQSVTVMATVTAVSPGSGTPTGSITFTIDGSQSGGTFALDSAGVATFSTSSLSADTHSIIATYSGDSGYSGSNSSALTQTVSQSSTSVGLSSSVNPSVYGQSVTLTATVTAVSPGSGTPAGVVIFYDGGTVLGSSTLSGSGMATFSTSSLSVSSHTLTAVYQGDANYGGSTSSQLSQVVGQSSTNVSLSSSVTPSVYGQSVTFTATVASVSPGSGIPAGTVVFYDGSIPLWNSTLSGSGVATFTTRLLSAGAHTITVTYTGDTNYLESSSTALTQTADQSSTGLTLSSSNNSSVFGQSVTFTAAVTAISSGSSALTGIVTFYNGSTALGTGTLSGSGVATFTTSSLSAGTHSITAAYEGDTNYSGSTSTILQAVASLITTPVYQWVHESISMDNLYARTTQTPTPTPLPSSSPSIGATPTATQTPVPTITSTPSPSQQQTTTSSSLPLWAIIVAIGIIAVAAAGYLFLRKQ